VYLAGSFGGTISVGSTSVTASGAPDLLVVKLDHSGGVVWARHAGGTGSVVPRRIVVDTYGNLLLAGVISGEARFGRTTLRAHGPTDAVVTRLDAEGEFVWATRVGGDGADAAMGIAVDSRGGLYLAGAFEGEVSWAEHPISSQGDLDGFVARLDGDGRPTWITALGGAGRDQVSAVAVSRWEQVYAAGSFTGKVQLGPAELRSAGLSDIFVVELDSTGAIQWSEHAHSAAADEVSTLVVDDAGNLAMAGYFGGAGTFGALTALGSGPLSAFVWRLGAP